LLLLLLLGPLNYLVVHNEMALTKIIVVHGGDLAKDVAEQLQAKKPASLDIEVELRSAAKSPKALLENANPSTLHCFIVQTVEMKLPPKRAAVLSGSFSGRLILRICCRPTKRRSITPCWV